MPGPLLPHAEKPLGANFSLADAVLWFPCALNLGNFRVWALIRDFISVAHRLWCRGSTFIGLISGNWNSLGLLSGTLGSGMGTSSFLFKRFSLVNTFFFRSHVAQSVWLKIFQCFRSVFRRSVVCYSCFHSKKVMSTWIKDKALTRFNWFTLVRRGVFFTLKEVFSNFVATDFQIYLFFCPLVKTTTCVVMCKTYL